MRIDYLDKKEKGAHGCAAVGMWAGDTAVVDAANMGGGASRCRVVSLWVMWRLGSSRWVSWRLGACGGRVALGVVVVGHVGGGGRAVSRRAGDVAGVGWCDVRGRALSITPGDVADGWVSWPVSVGCRRAGLRDVAPEVASGVDRAGSQGRVAVCVASGGRAGGQGVSGGAEVGATAHLAALPQLGPALVASPAFPFLLVVFGRRGGA
ncbi:hypothetical protein FPV67DRAFT_1507405 [Lyophyllum atratum]|nr:hypothetical protein FPV67DRAFT_1507405 [Lyophyllum atratum]